MYETTQRTLSPKGRTGTAPLPSQSPGTATLPWAPGTRCGSRHPPRRGHSARGHSRTVGPLPSRSHAGTSSVRRTPSPRTAVSRLSSSWWNESQEPPHSATRRGRRRYVAHQSDGRDKRVPPARGLRLVYADATSASLPRVRPPPRTPTPLTAPRHRPPSRPPSGPPPPRPRAAQPPGTPSRPSRG